MLPGRAGTLPEEVRTGIAEPVPFGAAAAPRVVRGITAVLDRTIAAQAAPVRDMTLEWVVAWADEGDGADSLVLDGGGMERLAEGPWVLARPSRAVPSRVTRTWIKSQVVVAGS